MGVTGILKSIFICAGKIQIASITQTVLEIFVCVCVCVRLEKTKYQKMITGGIEKKKIKEHFPSCSRAG